MLLGSSFLPLAACKDASGKHQARVVCTGAIVFEGAVHNESMSEVLDELIWWLINPRVQVSQKFKVDKRQSQCTHIISTFHVS